VSDRELKLNSLSRFSKQSPRFILEEYSNCEVPAGCGGAVLRWLTPNEPIPMKLNYFSNNGSLEMDSLDSGRRLWHSRIPVSYGSHVLTFEYKDFDPSFAVVMAMMQARSDYIQLLQPEGNTTILSLPDGTWKYSLEHMETDAWQKLDYDDSAWFPMIEQPPNPQSRWQSGDDYNIRKIRELTDQGAIGLGVDTDQPEVAQLVSRLLDKNGNLPHIYIRKTFSIRKKSTQE